MTNAFSPNYVPVIAVKPTPTRKPKPNVFDGNDHKARQTCRHLEKTHPHSRADHIKRSNSKV